MALDVIRQMDDAVIGVPICRVTHTDIDKTTACWSAGPR